MPPRRRFYDASHGRDNPPSSQHQQQPPEHSLNVNDPNAQLANLLFQAYNPLQQFQYYNNVQNPNPYFYQNQQFNFQNPNSSYHIQNPIPSPYSQQFTVQNQDSSPSQSQNPVQTPLGKQNPGYMLERLEQAVKEARSKLVAAGENVTAWKVSNEALAKVRAQSWDSLGLQMHSVYSLIQLMEKEVKINAFIHCFVGVRGITTIYDLEIAICQNEHIERFEQLELGPLLKHPLVLHYFMPPSDATEAFKISSKDVICALQEFMDGDAHKEIAVDEFLDYVVKKHSVTTREILGIRIQSLRMHINFIRDMKKNEVAMLKRNLKLEGNKKCNCRAKRPLLSYLQKEKKGMEERFANIRQRVQSFSSMNKDFCGKHIRFASSSSEDDESDDNVEVSKNDTSAGPGFLMVGALDKVGSCPYPSATEERSRLRMEGGIVGQSSADVNSSKKGGAPSRKRKRKAKVGSNTPCPPPKMLKVKMGKHKFSPSKTYGKRQITTNRTNGVLGKRTTGFISTWKEACKELTVKKVFFKMLDFYKPEEYNPAFDKKEVKRILKVKPYFELLRTAVASMKSGLWDSVCDNSQSITLCESTSEDSSKDSRCERNSVKPRKKNSTGLERDMVQASSATVEEIIARLGRFNEHDQDLCFGGKLLLDSKLYSLRKLCSCEFWLIDQFGVKDFKSLGHGEFFAFLEKYSSLLPPELQKISSNIHEKSLMEVCMLENQLVLLLSQAMHNCCKNIPLSKEMVSALLASQFPQITFQITENGSFDNFSEIVGKYKNNVTSNCVIFSATLSGKFHAGGDLSTQKKDSTLEAAVTRAYAGDKVETFSSITSKDAIEVLLRAPMLSDLNSWSHWDIKFAPYLGSLLRWLLSEVNSEELLCLVTKDGRVIRINQAATADAFLEAALQRSAFHTAVNLLSLFSLSGGEDHIPLSLLKCYSQRAFEAFSVEFSDDSKEAANLDVHEVTSNVIVAKAPNNVRIMNQVAQTASRFVLDCLDLIPLEFHGFAADVLISGMQFVIKDATSAILQECNFKERQMLHGIGLSLGVLEWINDYHSFCSTASDLFVSSETPCLELSKSSLRKEAVFMQHKYDNVSCPNNEALNEISEEFHGVSGGDVDSVHTEIQSDFNIKEDAALVIESIRREEFGLDPDLSSSESIMLKKQHARLGRALHCLSQDLYSQDSHFLLELVQNADDNSYPEDVEPTLAFILQESGIVVLNNEVGFTEKNVRALCDVGNSTKKVSGAGYIGQKGIGFKSVFRVTNAPEIHSNGFHIKFDISQGQIGFVLPTAVPPCNSRSFGKLLPEHTGKVGDDCWTTSIILPFRSKLSEQTAMEMFMDLHPSLLLFLHRLECLVFRNMLNDSLTVMRKEVLEDGIIKVSCGEEKMMWLVVSQKLKPHASLSRAETTEISIAFTLEDSDDGHYKPRLNLQPVFAFLPLRTYGMKFILQGDFVLPSSREEVDKNNVWNEWLLTKIPSLFVNAERSFCGISCFRDNLGKAITAYMSFVPLVGEVHGFFSGLPKAIISELRRTSCLLLEGDHSKMVPPCNVLRGWNDNARKLMPGVLLQEHLGLGFLDKDIVLPDSLARALGIAEYGPEILVKFITQICNTKCGVQKMGMDWLSSSLSALYAMLSHSSVQTDLIDKLRSIPLVPLSDGSYSSVDAGTIWLPSDVLGSGAQSFEAFPQLSAKLRIVNTALFSSLSIDGFSSDHLSKMLYKIGVQQLSAHEVIKVHILPALSEERINDGDMSLMVDYVCFVMIHLQSTCPGCNVDRTYIMSELQSKGYILTNYGFKRQVETPIHFSKEFGNPIDISKIYNGLNMKCHELDALYLKHPANRSLSSVLPKWREFFQNMGVTDFLQVVQVDKGISDLSQIVLKNLTMDKNLISPGSTVKDWESNELVKILSILSTSGDLELSKYLLEILDALWDDNFSNKVSGCCNLNSAGDGRPFQSSFMSSICNVRWIASSLDSELHYARDLFYDCDSVRALLGASAPYALPKVRSLKLLSDIGFKNQVSLDDALTVLRSWTQFQTPFMASITQMLRFYLFIWEEMASSRNKIIEAFNSEPFIFIPYDCSSRHENLVSGVFLFAKEVYWHDPTGSVTQMSWNTAHRSSSFVIQQPLSKSLCKLYPNLHDFFVNECGVPETPSCIEYLDMLQQLSAVTVPSQAAGSVYQIFMKWAEALKSGLLNSDDMLHLKECLKTLEYTVLPTDHDKWVSLHPSFGLVCWSDDKKLRKTLKNMNKLDYVYFGSLAENDDDFVPKLTTLMHSLGIPALSEVVTREAIYTGLADNRSKALLINWVLPYTQRYIYSMYPDKYSQLRQSGFDRIKQLHVLVVEELFYRNVIRLCGVASKKRHECSCLLQGNTLYTTLKTDSHSLFLELSCLFFDGSQQLHLANFLHMITTMGESGSTEEQIELFIVRSQKVPKLPDDEEIWQLSSLCLTSNDGSSPFSSSVDQQNVLTSKKQCVSSSDWPPVDWRTAPPSSSFEIREAGSNDMLLQAESSVQINVGADCNIAYDTVELGLPISETIGDQIVQACDQIINVDPASGSSLVPAVNNRNSTRNWAREKLNTGAPDPVRAILTGKLGERVAYKYFSEKRGSEAVRWVNADAETGTPFDIMIDTGDGTEFIEVKTTRSAIKDWFEISTRELQFGFEKGDAFSIAHVVLSSDDRSGRVAVYKNLAKQLQQRNLQVVVMMPNQLQEVEIVNL